MHRYGFTRDELEAFDPTGLSFSVAGVFTHFYASSNDALTTEQHADFLGCVELLRSRGIDPGIVHCCASGAFLRCRDMHHDMVRLGSALVGTPDGLERIWKLETAAAAVRPLKKNDRLGYGGWKIRRNAVVASLPVGFSDGLLLERFEPVGFYGALRRFGKDILRPSCPIRVLYGGHEVPVLGGAGTTHLTVDVTGTGAAPGDSFTVESNPMFLSPDIPRVYAEEL
jgi:alanine racemase